MTMTAERMAELDAVMAKARRLVDTGFGAFSFPADLAPMIEHIEAQAATIARLEAERVFVLGAGECVTNWGAYHGEPCVFLEPLVGGAGVQGEPVPDSEKHGPHVLRNGSVVLVLRGEPVAFLEDIETARAALTGAAS